MNPPRPRRLLRAARLMLALLPAAALADPRVAVTASANPGYTSRKFGHGKPEVETYVFLQGHYFEGATVDRSIERMPFRRIAEYLGVELARQNYLPARTLPEASLLIVVHWGTTIPRVTNQEMSGRTSLTTDAPGEADIHAQALIDATEPPDFPPPHDTNRAPLPNDLLDLTAQLSGNLTTGNGATLLGYNEELYRLGKDMWSGTKEAILFDHLSRERYFITLVAYDLKEETTPGSRRRPVWSVHLNISSPGNNFTTALSRISTVAVNYAGRTTDGMQTIRPKERATSVTLGELVILGEAK